MKKEPILVVMAAGMGSRYGGLKQMDPMGAAGELLVDYSLFDACRAGFRRVVFVIRKAHEEEFRRLLAPAKPHFDAIDFAFQELEMLPVGFSLPPDRQKPWGTAHAVLCAKALVDGPFAVINADDFYGRHGFFAIFSFLAELEKRPSEKKAMYAMVSYAVGNTVTENGSVARGVCHVDTQGFLQEIQERTRIEVRPEGIAYTLDEGKSWIPLAADTPVSLNFWGFDRAFMDVLGAGFPDFLAGCLKENPLKGEYFLPTAVENQLKAQAAQVQMLSTPDKWYGVTYQADKPLVTSALREMTKAGIYPEKLWGEG